MHKTFIYLLILSIAGLVACKPTKEVSKSKKEEISARSEPAYIPGKDNTTLFIDALNEVHQGNLNQAIVLFQKCITLDPDDGASRYELAKCYSQTGQVLDAIQQAENAVALDPENSWYQLLLARLYSFNGNYEMNIKILETLTENNPGNVDFLLELASAYQFLNEHEKTLLIYDKIENIVGVDEKIVQQKINILNQSGRGEEAIREVEKLVGKFPNESRYYAMLAETYLAHGKHEAAEKAYLQVVEVNPEDPFIHISLSDFYKKQGRQDKAYHELKLGFANTQLDIDTKVQILLTYYTLNGLYEESKEEALELTRILIQAHPNNPKAHAIMADLLYRQGELEEAQRNFLQVLALDSSNYMVWEQLLFIESELQNYKDLARDSDRAISLFPQQPLLYLFAAISNYQLKAYQHTIELLNRGLNFVVGNNQLKEQFYAYLGDAHHQLKNYAQSDKAYDASLRLNPENAIVLNNYAYYLSLRGENLQKAEQMAQRSVKLDSTNSANLDTYGWVLYKLNKLEDAKIWVYKAILHGGENNPTLLEHYGDILYKLGETAEAIKYWQRASEAGKGSDLLEKKLNEKKLYE